MVRVDTFKQLADHVGTELGVSDWKSISQPMIDQFGALTGDEHWIHVDAKRAAAEGPFGSTVAHGFLTLALLTGLLKDCFQVTGAKRWINYGLDRVRFTSPVPPSSRLRLRLVLASVEVQSEGETRLRCGCTLEIEGGTRPALVADFLMVGYEQE